jgi:hypothetical protein
MNKLKRKISIFTVFTVTMVMFLGLICPMGMVNGSEGAHADCSGGQVLGISNPNEMGDCMNGKLGFLGNFLVSMPESLFSLVILAFVLAFVFQFGLVKEIFSTLIQKVRWRCLQLVYLNKVKIKFLKTFIFWFTTVSSPVVIA